MYTTQVVDFEKQLHVLQWLHAHCFPSDEQPDWSVGSWWITWEDKQPIAFIGVQPVDSWKHTLYISRVGVVTEYRGHGLQRFLMKKVEQAARNMFARIISTTYENPASANNFIACGYTTYLPQVPWGSAGTIYWIKNLV